MKADELLVEFLSGASSRWRQKQPSVGQGAVNVSVPPSFGADYHPVAACHSVLLLLAGTPTQNGRPGDSEVNLANGISPNNVARDKGGRQMRPINSF